MSTTSEMAKPTWKKFERHVEQIFKLAGYEVEYDTLTKGGQTDLIATKSLGPLTTRLLVECKYSDIGKSVGIDAVENFSGRIISLRSDDIIDAGMLVTNTSFTRNARAFTQKSYLILMTVDQLYSIIFDFRPYLIALIEDFERSRLNTTFVRPLMDSFNYDDIITSTDDSSGNNQDHEEDKIDIIEFCDKWLTIQESKRLCLLGDYGTGKTSFCQWYTMHRAKKNLGNLDNEPIPLLIPLHRFTISVDIDALVTDFLVNQCQIGNFRLNAFQFLLEQGRFLIILDGFDEMARHVDREVRYQTIAELSKLARGASKVILTGRPSYFPTDEELVEALGGSEQTELYAAARNAYNELVDYDFYKVRLFSINQIREFVLKSVGDPKQSERILTYIEKRYDLFDLASRPVLLDMIVKSLPRLLSIEPLTTVNAAKLYDIYTGLWLDREYKKGEFRKLIRKDDKLRFMEELSFQLFVEDKHSLPYIKIGEPIRDFFKITDTELDYFSHDIRTCSFLHRLPLQGYTFAHRSFQEFFVAKKLLRAVKLKDPSPWNVRHLPVDIVRFVSELISEEDDKVKKLLSAWSDSNFEEIQIKNCLLVALLTGAEIFPSMLELYQMDSTILRGYAAFKIGDDSGSTKFIEYLYYIILNLIDLMRYRLLKLKIDPDDMIGDVFFQANKLIKTQSLKTAKELDLFFKKIIIGLAKEREKTMKDDVNIEDFIRECRDKGIFIDPDSLMSTYDTPLKAIESSQIIDVCMASLNEMERKIINYYYFEEKSLVDIAKIIKKHPNTVRALLSRIHIRLKRILGTSDNA